MWFHLSSVNVELCEFLKLRVNPLNLNISLYTEVIGTALAVSLVVVQGWVEAEFSPMYQCFLLLSSMEAGLLPPLGLQRLISGGCTTLSHVSNLISLKIYYIHLSS